MKKTNPKIRRGSANVSADLGFPDPETHLLKAEMASRFQQAMDDQELTQSSAAKIVGMGQSDVSRILHGRFRDVSVEKIVQMRANLVLFVSLPK
ncbi:MAG TPA: XRE family transcriptional regulator [Rhizomicrobium sp.]|jgi:predicted XRE-type DNA-binding protein